MDSYWRAPFLLSPAASPLPACTGAPSGFSGGVLPPGFGLGLAITKEMVEKLGGEISVSSSAEDGTVFQVILCR